jgi:hypothetical protein
MPVPENVVLPLIFTFPLLNFTKQWEELKSNSRLAKWLGYVHDGKSGEKLQQNGGNSYFEAFMQAHIICHEF